jgi:hypothetical protein
MLMNEGDFDKKIPKHWELSDEHKQDIQTFLDNYYE